MPIDPILVLVLVALLANLALIIASRGRFEAAQAGDETDVAGRVSTVGPSAGGAGGALSWAVQTRSDLRPAALDWVIHVGTWVFLFATTVIVAVSGLWVEREALILLVLAAAAATTVVVHVLTERLLPDPWRRGIGGLVRLVFAGLLVSLTGGALSPFFFALPLLVVGAAVVIRPTVTLALTACAGVVYLASVIVANATAGNADLSSLALATAGVNLTALCLVAYVGMAIGREQRRARELANQRATVDPLTGLRTRPYLFDALEAELARSQRTGRGFCLLMIDLDDLKVVNDRHGHLVGDRALRLVGDVILAGIRRIDTGARFGGDEFVVLLPETDATGGWVLAEKIRQGVSDGGLTAEGVPLPTSVSIGAAVFPRDGETVGELLECADAAMYGAKRSGRERSAGIPVMDVSPERAGDRANPV